MAVLLALLTISGKSPGAENIEREILGIWDSVEADGSVELKTGGVFLEGDLHGKPTGKYEIIVQLRRKVAFC